MDPLTWDWAGTFKSVISFGVGGALVGALFTLGAQRFRDRRRAAYMAGCLARNLETYALLCAEFISDNANLQPPPDDHEFPAWNLGLPEISPHPNDPEGWQVINPELVERCQSFDRNIQQSQSTINDAVFLAEDDLGDLLDETAASLGLEAWRLALDLRRWHKVGARSIATDPTASLRGILSSAKKALADRREANAKCLAEFMQNDSA